MNNTKAISSNLVVIFGNNKISNGEFLRLKEVQTQPKIGFKLEPNKIYTFVIVDPDTPKGYHIHQCTYNLSINSKITPVQYYIYAPPSPPPGTGPNKDGKHRYYCIMYEQDGKIEGRKEMLGRAFEDYDYFKKLLGVPLKAVSYKYFVCKNGN